MVRESLVRELVRKDNAVNKTEVNTQVTREMNAWFPAKVAKFHGNSYFDAYGSPFFCVRLPSKWLVKLASSVNKNTLKNPS